MILSYDTIEDPVNHHRTSSRTRSGLFSNLAPPLKRYPIDWSSVRSLTSLKLRDLWSSGRQQFPGPIFLTVIPKTGTNIMLNLLKALPDTRANNTPLMRLQETKLDWSQTDPADVREALKRGPLAVQEETARSKRRMTAWERRMVL